MVSFSGGRTSAYMTIKLLEVEKFNENNTVICFANTGREAEETLEFVDKVDKYLGGDKIVWLEYDNQIIPGEFTKKGRNKYHHTFKKVDFETADRKGLPFEKLIKARNYVPNRVTRFCTQELKIRPIKKFMMSLGYKHWNNLVGIRYDEPGRYFKLIENDKKERWENSAPLWEWKITKKDVLSFWEKMPFNLELEEIHGNCDFCFLKGMAKRLRIAQTKPDNLKWWMAQEDYTKSTFMHKVSVSRILDKANNQFQILYQDSDDEDCFCNIN